MKTVRSALLAPAVLSLLWFATPPQAPSPDTAPHDAGLVNWHADFASACAAAEHSGKPVLLFDLLGRLDQEFC